MLLIKILIFSTIPVETHCPDISGLPGTNLSHNATGVDDTVTIECVNTSHRFLDGKEIKHLVCLSTGEWSELVSDCSGKASYSCLLCYKNID